MLRRIWAQPAPPPPQPPTGFGLTTSAARRAHRRGGVPAGLPDDGDVAQDRFEVVVTRGSLRRGFSNCNPWVAHGRRSCRGPCMPAAAVGVADGGTRVRGGGRGGVRVGHPCAATFGGTTRLEAGVLRRGRLQRARMGHPRPAPLRPGVAAAGRRLGVTRGAAWQWTPSAACAAHPAPAAGGAPASIEVRDADAGAPAGCGRAARAAGRGGRAARRCGGGSPAAAALETRATAAPVRARAAPVVLWSRRRRRRRHFLACCPRWQWASPRVLLGPKTGCPGRPRATLQCARAIGPWLAAAAALPTHGWVPPRAERRAARPARAGRGGVRHEVVRQATSSGFLQASAPP